MTQQEAQLHAIVSGRVQGVGFRFFVRSEAVQLGLVGWVRNLDSGDVKVLAEGDRAKLDELVKKLEQGPRGSDVVSVSAEWGDAKGEFQKFDVAKNG